jgi:hypothetical protein
VKACKPPIRKSSAETSGFSSRPDWRNGEQRKARLHRHPDRREPTHPGASVAQRFVIAPTEGSTKPASVTITNAGIAGIEQIDLRMP